MVVKVKYTVKLYQNLMSPGVRTIDVESFVIDHKVNRIVIFVLRYFTMYVKGV